LIVVPSKNGNMERTGLIYSHHSEKCYKFTHLRN
jgi:hypothetical protein